MLINKLVNNVEEEKLARHPVNKILSQIPKVDRLIEQEPIQKLIQQYPRNLVIELLRDILADMRAELIGMADKGLASAATVQKVIIERVIAKLSMALKPKMRHVINAAGIILNTGLGRAPLSQQAQQALLEASKGFSSIEIDLATGSRGNRHFVVEDLLTKLTGAEAAVVVNNNAAATLLILNTLAFKQEVIVSRGELITIGGSFRLPDIMKKSGAIMREVGTTNQTNAWEYEEAINEDTGLLLKVHTSNYKIVGFVSETSLGELVAIGNKFQVPVFHDLGSGSLFDLSLLGLPKEPVVSESIKAGADIVSFSGDKLLGGPQAGIIAGKKEYIDEIKKNQLTRALRCGKLTYAALEATLRLYFDKEELLKSLPGLRFMLRDSAELEKKAERLKIGLQKILMNRGETAIENGFTEVGGGSLATESLPTLLVSLQITQLSPDDLGKRLRLSDPPIISRIVNDKIVFDIRTLFDNELKLIHIAVEKILQDLSHG